MARPVHVEQCQVVDGSGRELVRRTVGPLADNQCAFEQWFRFGVLGAFHEVGRGAVEEAGGIAELEFPTGDRVRAGQGMREQASAGGPMAVLDRRERGVDGVDSALGPKALLVTAEAFDHNFLHEPMDAVAIGD